MTGSSSRGGRGPGLVAPGMVAVAPVLLALVVLDLTDASARRWFDDHAFTSAVITSILVLLITVLIIDRVVAARAQRDRSVVIGAQAAIVSRQGRRTLELVAQVQADAAQRGAASDELRTYMAMLLVSAPVLIEAPAARAFLESAQRLAALMSWALERGGEAGPAGVLEGAAQQMQQAAQPLLATLDLAELRAVEEPAGDVASTAEGGQTRAGT